MANLFLEMNEVSKTIKKQLVVHPFNLKLEKSRVLALCGANGAGKSTIIRMIAGMTQPTSGSITLDGLQWKKQRKAYAELMGYMPDDFTFGTALSAWETIRFYAALRGVEQERVREVMELVDLYDVRAKSVSTFSKGMRQRLMFAQAILAKPQLLLLDEPTNGLDPYWMGMFTELIHTIKEEGTTIIFSTHQLDIADEAADEAIFLHEGKVLSRGTIAHYKEKYGENGLEAVYADIFQKKY